MHRIKDCIKSCIKYFFVFTLLFYSSLGRTEDLLCVFQLAEINDPFIQAAKAAQLAAREALPQARAKFMPIIAANSSTKHHDYLYASNQAVDVPTEIFPSDLHYNQSIYGLTLTQPVFYYRQWVQLAKASEEVKQANALFAAAEQDLIMRTVESYFRVLKAADSLKFAKEAHKAFSKFANYTEEKFKVGLVTNADRQLARAQRDIAYAEEIEAANELENRKEQLRVITGKRIDDFSFLRDNVILRPPEPANIEEWVCRSVEQNFTLLAAQFRVEVFRQDVKLHSARHLPIINLTSGLSHATSIPTSPRYTYRTFGLQVQMPIFNGGSTTSKTREAVYTYERVLSEMEAVYRQTQSDARQAYLGVLTEISQAAAQQQAVLSNRGALEATETAFEIGTRTISDVLRAQSDLIKAEENYAFARYDYILQSVLLKLTAGILTPEDVCHINAMLKD